MLTSSFLKPSPMTDPNDNSALFMPHPTPQKVLLAFLDEKEKVQQAPSKALYLPTPCTPGHSPSQRVPVGHGTTTLKLMGGQCLPCALGEIPAHSVSLGILGARVGLFSIDPFLSTVSSPARKKYDQFQVVVSVLQMMDGLLNSSFN